MVKRQIKAEENQHEQSNRPAQPSVPVHRVSDPVARARVPQDSGDVGQQKSLSWGGGQQLDRGVKLQSGRLAGPE